MRKTGRCFLLTLLVFATVAFAGVESVEPGGGPGIPARSEAAMTAPLAGDFLLQESETPPVAEAPTLYSNVQIGTATNVIALALGRDAASDHLFAAQLLSDDWGVFLSSNAGASWSSTFNWNASGSDTLDLAVASGYAWVGYNDGTAARLRRFSVATGAADLTYGFETVVNVSPKTIRKIVLASNADDYDNRIFYAILMTDGTVRWFWIDSVLFPDVFNEISPSISNAADYADNLSMSWRKGGYDGSETFLALAYLSTGDAIRVYRIGGASWDAGTSVATSETAAEEASISVFESTIFVAFESPGASGQNIEYRISYNLGTSWAGGTLGAATPGQSYYQPLVSAWSGTGTAVLMQQETGTLDDLWFRERHNYSGGSFMSPTYLNDYGYYPATAGFDFEWLGHGWAVAYITTGGRAYFTWSRAIAYRGFESGDMTEW